MDKQTYEFIRAITLIGLFIGIGYLIQRWVA